MSRWFKSHERSDFKRAQNFLDSSRIVMNIAIETMRCISDCDMLCHEMQCRDKQYTDKAYEDQQRELITVVILNVRFLNKNLDDADHRFSKWEQILGIRQPERHSRLRCMLINARKNFDVARRHTAEINDWLKFDSVPAAMISES